MTIPELQLITQDLEGKSHAMQAEEACEAGIRWIQFRSKRTDRSKITAEAKAVVKVCRHYDSVCIINDNPYLALETGADGVHVGKNDPTPDEARLILGQEAIIGCTANSFDDILQHATSDIAYFGIGPYRFTSTKRNLSPILGPEGLTDIVHRMRQASIDIPLVAIGGILPEDVLNILHTGIHGVAVASAINEAASPIHEAHRFIATLQLLSQPLA
ncbi:MAG: thiamine phosphate synthase [Flavobacteriales bacterium]|nr:thiamine phosphate synthase [Flavobacteriales bacterium]MCB9448410.1 thiamine phosphate synthase [Flavobacteriales bacterium]